MSLSLDFTNMIAPTVAGGVSASELAEAGQRFRQLLERVVARHSAGELGFMDLPSDTQLLQSSVELAAQLAGRADDIVVLGIGGSALGTIALRSALLPPYWNLKSTAERESLPRLHVLDNVDPRSIEGLLSLLNLRRSIFLVISKSGGTAETMAQYLVVRNRLEAALGKEAARDHLIFITDPVSGILRPLAGADGIAALAVPSNVGGRFSILTPVSMLPAQLTGIDAGAILRGAAAMLERCRTPELSSNPAGVYAVLQWSADIRHGAGIHVFMPYADSLREFAAWFVQLWAESLGKVTHTGEHTGPTPLAALGATDQHSQVQLFMEGPVNKTVTFISESARPLDCTVPEQVDGPADLDYLGGHTLGELLDHERRATAGALAARGRPNMTIEMPVVDAHHVGELIMLLQMATVFAGELYNVNPLDQPGVELGKQFTYALLGKPGSEAALSEWQTLPQSVAEYRV